MKLRNAVIKIRRNRKNYITDYDHNRMVDLITGFHQYASYPKRLRVYSGDASTLMTLIKRNYSGQFRDIEVARESGSKPFVRVFFNSEPQRIALEDKLRNLVAQGHVTGYTDSGVGVTQDGSNVPLSGSPAKGTSAADIGGSVNGVGGGISTAVVIAVAVVLIGGYLLLRKKK